MRDSTVCRFFGEERPTSVVGRLALARVLRDEVAPALSAKFAQAHHRGSA
jgi:hypothetical protein